MLDYDTTELANSPITDAPDGRPTILLKYPVQ